MICLLLRWLSKIAQVNPALEMLPSTGVQGRSLDFSKNGIFEVVFIGKWRPRFRVFVVQPEERCQQLPSRA